MGGALGNVPQLTMCASIANGYTARRHRQNFTAALVSHWLCRHGDAALREFSLTIEALRRKLRQPASSLSWFAHGRRAWKIHGIARPLHNSEKRARYNLARAVSGFSAISELAHSLHQTEHGLFRVPPKIRARLKTSVKRRNFGRSVEEG